MLYQTTCTLHSTHHQNHLLPSSSTHPQFLYSPKSSTSTTLPLCVTLLLTSPIPSLRWKNYSHSGPGGGLLSGPPPQWLFIARLLGHQHDNVTMRQGFLKEILCLLSVLSPWRATATAGSGDLKSAVKEQGQLWSHNVKRMDFLINLSWGALASDWIKVRVQLW